eukprot:PhF_6_TR15643/c0_g1_i3/m.24297
MSRTTSPRTPSCGCSCCVNGQCADPAECQKALIGVGVAVGVILIAIVAYCIYRRRQQQQNNAAYGGQMVASGYATSPMVGGGGGQPPCYSAGGPTTMCPQDGACALVNDPSHQMQYLHRCAFPRPCPYVQDPHHAKNFLH